MNAAVAIIMLDDERYLCQLRSQRARIYYPDHWGLFGGAVEPGESAEEGLRRELREELSLEVKHAEFFTEFTFDFGFQGFGILWRRFYIVPLAASRIADLTLGEGREVRAFTARELLDGRRVVPYDAFAIWLHATQRTPT
jgi:8-oxo-dGTP pyrophosphatase MutT (NUDIX family)